MREYRAYARSIGLKLERLPAEKFQPNLKLFDELITSIEIDANADKLMSNNECR